jgi:hypothetical protein
MVRHRVLVSAKKLSKCNAMLCIGSQHAWCYSDCRNWLRLRSLNCLAHTASQHMLPQSCCLGLQHAAAVQSPLSIRQALGRGRRSTIVDVILIEMLA